MSNKIFNSLIDVPRRADQDDLFGIDKYTDALVQFIEMTNTPITIAIQGEWGSGKTSLMNKIKDQLCDQEGKRFYPIWLNTWQYSLMKSEAETLISIINGLTNEIADIATAKNNKLGQMAKRSLGILNKIAGASVKVAVNAATGQNVGEIVDALGDARETTILKLRDSLNELIANVVADSDKSGFLFFIDDLDRIDPPVAVNILELLKNIFDLDNCIFILAIDYDVVVKGLEPKFGKLTDKNEREFRSFFDKIIQLPFSMPIASYEISTFLSNSLKDIGYLNEADFHNKEMLDKLSVFTNHSLGNNPRSLKRLMNTLSLIEIINKVTMRSVENEDSDSDKLVNYALVCTQIAYPAIYKALCEEPDFISWGENTANKFKLRKLEDHEVENLKKSEEFDEEWEQVLFRLCENDNYLSKRVFNISSLLNSIKNEIPDGEDVGNYISAILELSSVTDVQAFVGPKKIGDRAEAQLGFREFVDSNIDSKLIEPFKGVNLSSGELSRTQRIWFNDEDGKHFCEVRFLINLSNGNLIFSINDPVYVVDATKCNAIEDPKYQALLSNYDSKFEGIYEKYGFTVKNKLVPGLKLNRPKTGYVTNCKAERKYQNELDFYNPENLNDILEIMVSFGHCMYELLVDLRELNP